MTSTPTGATTSTPTRPDTPPELDLLPGDVEEDLRRSVRAVLDKHCTTDRLVALADGAPDGATEADWTAGVAALTWAALARDLGLAALLVPEGLGGAGATTREAAVVAEECGRACAPVPFLTSAVLATTLLVRLDLGDLLGPLAAGEQTAALLLPATTRRSPLETGVTETGGRLTGELRGVVGLPADLLLVLTATDGRHALHAVPASATGVEIALAPSLDSTRPVADVRLDGATGTLLASGPEVTAAMDAALTTAAALLAAEQAGVARWCLETTVAHLKERRQFGRVVGGFQALKHRLADLYADVEQASAAAGYAAAALAAGTDPVAVPLAQAYCAGVAVHAAEEAVQLHGGLGMTWESPVHLRLKRAKADHAILGTPDAHHDDLARLVDLPGPTGAAEG